MIPDVVAIRPLEIQGLFTVEFHPLLLDHVRIPVAEAGSGDEIKSRIVKTVSFNLLCMLFKEQRAY